MADEIEIGNWFEPEGGKRFWWKLCKAKFCQHFVCRGYSDDYCYVHMTPEQRKLKDGNPTESET